MSRRDSQDAQTLDQHFEDILIKLEPYLLSLPKKHSRLCRLWLDRLKCAYDQRNLRNDYLLELYKQLKNGCFNSPFKEPPLSGRLIPISNCHRLVTSSSCNELTETKFSPCEKQKRAWPKPRSKSLRRDTTQCRNKTPTRHFDIHSSSSPNRVSHVENSAVLSPIVHFYEQQDKRNLLRTYREKIESLNNIVHDLECQNEKLKQKLTFYHNALASDEVPRLHARIRQLLAEIAKLKSKLTEVQEIKTILEKRHTDIIEMYKKRFTEQFDKMKSAHIENKALNEKIALFEQKLQDSNQQNEFVESNSKEWEQKIESLKSEYESILQEKDEEIKKKGDLVQQKEMELSEKLNEISSLSQKIKSQDDGQSRLAEQYKSVKEEMSTMIQHMENTARKQNESHQQEISALKKNFQKLEKLTHKLTSREKERALVGSQMWLQDMYNLAVMAFLDKHRKIGGPDQIFENEYKKFLNFIESFADKQRCEYFKKLAFLKSQKDRLQNG